MLDQPVTIDDAAAAGVSWKRLQSRRWRKLAPGVYVNSRRQLSPLLDLVATARRLPSEAVFSGCTAGWLHGLDLAPCSPIDITVPAGHAVARRAGVRLHKRRLDQDEIVIRHDLRTTSAVRTIFDLGSQSNRVDAVAALDMALNAGLTVADELTEIADLFRGRKGIARFRRAADLADAAESPMETRVRLILLDAGLPRPISQANLFDGKGRFIARTDLYYPSHRLCIEYDGGQHRDTLAEDNRRQNLLVDAGYSVLRFTAADVLKSPDRLVAIVHAALTRRPLGDFDRNGRSSRSATGDFDQYRPGLGRPG